MDAVANGGGGQAVVARLGMEKGWRWTELIVLFGALPVLLEIWRPPAGWLPVLGLVALAVGWKLRQETGPAKRWWAPVDWRQAAPELKRIGWRFAFSTMILAAGIQLWRPKLWFDFPRHQPTFWLAVVLLYPLLSVYVQELVYRRYFFTRFGGLFANEGWLVLGSALSFSWAHLIFHNGVAVALTLIGGCFFADTYRRTGSLRLVCLEHTLYGNLVFTIGLARFFFQHPI